MKRLPPSSKRDGSARDPNLNGIFILTAPAHLYLGKSVTRLIGARRSVLERPQHAVPHSWIASAAPNLGDNEAANASLAEFRRLLTSYTITSFRDERLCATTCAAASVSAITLG